MAGGFWRFAPALALLVAASLAHADAQQIAGTVCVACHGEDGNSAIPTFPRLAGLHPDYIEKQLRDFMSGKRKSDVMAPILGTIKDSDVKDLAAYYGSRTPKPGSAGEAAKVAAGKQLYEDGNTASGVPACMGCHQPLGAGNERYPRLAGQHSDYTTQQMTQFKAGARTNDKGKVMRAVAERLTEQEIADVAEYLASQ